MKPVRLIIPPDTARQADAGRKSRLFCQCDELRYLDRWHVRNVNASNQTGIAIDAPDSTNTPIQTIADNPQNFGCCRGESSSCGQHSGHSVSGGLTVFSSFFLFAPFIQAFWLLSLGFLYLGTGRQAEPPAWRTGQAEPWPSQREIAAQKQAARQPAPEAVEAQPVPAGRPHPSSKKRKRKRRD